VVPCSESSSVKMKSRDRRCRGGKEAQSSRGSFSLGVLSARKRLGKGALARGRDYLYMENSSYAHIRKGGKPSSGGKEGERLQLLKTRFRQPLRVSRRIPGEEESRRPREKTAVEKRPFLPVFAKRPLAPGSD